MFHYLFLGPHVKFWPDRFSRFDVYSKQTDTQTSKVVYKDRSFKKGFKKTFLTLKNNLSFEF